MEQVGDRQVLAQLRHHLGIFPPARGGIGDQAGIVQRLIDRRIQIAPVVLPCPAVQELIQVAIRIHPARPADQVGLKIALGAGAKRGRELEQIKLQVEPRLPHHRLDDLGQLGAIRGVRHVHRHRDRGFHPRLLHQGNRLGNVARRWFHARHVERRGWRDRLQCRLIHAVEHHIHQRLPVDRGVKRLPQQRILADRTLGTVTVAQIEGYPFISQRG